MTAGRRRLIIALIAVLLGAHYAAIAFKLEHWPLSHYGMFARPKPSTVTAFVLTGVTPGGEEVRLHRDEYWRPHRVHKLAYSLRTIQGHDARRTKSAPQSAPLMPSTVKSLLAHYETRRHAGEHEGPPLAGLRLYSVQWQIDPELSNLNVPDRRELVCECIPPR